MITLGIILSKLLSSNPALVVMTTRKLEAGKVVEIEGIKMAHIDGKSVLVLTI